MILDIGSKRTNIIIVEKGIPFVSRSINIGGNSITSELMRQMSLSEEDAERMKRDLGTVSPGDSSSEGLPKLLEMMMLPLVNEIRFAFQLYANMDLAQIKKVEKIVVTGGSAHLPKIPEYLAQVLNLNVFLNKGLCGTRDQNSKLFLFWSFRSFYRVFMFLLIFLCILFFI